MKLTSKNILQSSLVIALFAITISFSGCAVRVAPASGPVVVQKHRCQRHCRVHHPRRHPRRRVVVVRR